MTQKERENFYRNSTVIVDHGKESLSAVLNNDLANSNMTFEDFINKHQHDIYHLCYNRITCCQCTGGPANQSKILYPNQLDILFDKNGSTLNRHNPNTPKTFQYCCRPAKQYLLVADLDITLLRCLLINFAKNCQTNPNIKQDIEDLVKYRNKLYGHATEARLSNSDYAKFKTDVECIILRIAQFCNIENEMRQKLNDASQRPLDETILKQYQIALLQHSLCKKNIQEKFYELQQQLVTQDERLHHCMDTMEEGVNTVGQRKQNIIAQTEARLLEHSKDDTHVITDDVEVCCEVLDTYNVLILFAKTGGGKSKTSLQIAKRYRDELFTPMLFVNDEITRNRDLINFNNMNIIVVEDLFSRSNVNIGVDENLQRGFLDVLYSSIKNESCKSKLIITVQGSEVNNRKLIETHKIFEKDFIINLDKIRSFHTKRIIFLKHMAKNRISLCNCATSFPREGSSLFAFSCRTCVSETTDCSMEMCISVFRDVCYGQDEMPIGFPQACHLFCSNKNLTKQGTAYFTTAPKSLVNEIMNLKTQGFDNKLMQYQYCVLVYTTIKGSLDMDNIDEHCFQNILSYFESHKLKMSFFKEAVRKLEGTYFTKTSSKSIFYHSKRQKVSDTYVLHQSIIREAILITYGDDTDVLSFCDSRFLFEYIRPNGFTNSPNDQMVFVYTDYKLLANKLSIILATDDYTCTCSIGVYLQKVALTQRRDEIIRCFFENVEDLKPEQYTCLINGLTDFGENADFIKFHPQLCKNIFLHGGKKVFLAFCRPKGWLGYDTHFVEIETDLLIDKLYNMMSCNGLDENCQETKTIERTGQYYILKLFNYPFAVGNYVFENLISKGFLDIADSLLTQLKQRALAINPIHIKEFLDGLLDEGKRSWAVSHFTEFFEAVLFKYGSIPTVLQLCRPLTSNISNSDIIQVDDFLLTGKLSAHLESLMANMSDLEKISVLRENGEYFVYWDYNYLEMKYISDIAKFILEQGVKINNHKFVKTMFEQLVSDLGVVDDKLAFAYDSSYDENCGEDVHILNKVVFGDYPGDEIEEYENGLIVCKFKGFLAKVKYCDDRFLLRPPCCRLLEFLYCLVALWILDQDFKIDRMTILRHKFIYLCQETGEVDSDYGFNLMGDCT